MQNLRAQRAFDTLGAPDPAITGRVISGARSVASKATRFEYPRVGRTARHLQHRQIPAQSATEVTLSPRLSEYSILVFSAELDNERRFCPAVRGIFDDSAIMKDDRVCQ